MLDMNEMNSSTTIQYQDGGILLYVEIGGTEVSYMLYSAKDYAIDIIKSQPFFRINDNNRSK